jgi:hypothetical protein
MKLYFIRNDLERNGCGGSRLGLGSGGSRGVGSQTIAADTPTVSSSTITT